MIKAEKKEKILILGSAPFVLLAIIMITAGYYFYGTPWGLFEEREQVIFADSNVTRALNEQAASLGITLDSPDEGIDHILLAYVTYEEFREGITLRNFDAKLLTAVYLPVASDERLAVYQISIFGHTSTSNPTVFIGNNRIRLHCSSTLSGSERRLNCVAPADVTTARLRELPSLEMTVSTDIDGQWIHFNSLARSFSQQPLYFAWNYADQTGVALVPSSEITKENSYEH